MSTENGISAGSKRPKKFLKIILVLLSVVVILCVVVYISFQVSPWPSALLIRSAFTKDGVKLNDELGKHVKGDISSELNLQYIQGDDDAYLDLYYPENFEGKENLPLIVWVHGGAFIAGDKSEISNYCKILASKGYIVAAVNYSLAPSKNYPLPVSQVNSAIGFLYKNAGKYKINTEQIFLGGDSGGAHISAQLSNVFAERSYSDLLQVVPSIEPSLLKGVILYCGPYNAELVNMEGAMGGFLKTVLWSYMGSKDFMNDPGIKSFSVSNYLTGNFPRAFISVGNEDPLGPHSHELASRLVSKGVKVDSLFFPGDHKPGLPHEYQFNMDTEAGKIALERTVEFIKSFSAVTTDSTK
ncbi:MAG TPA: alpha/beta hydrolase [Ignavibacteria bacterium]|nr:alpha/beta hydrolase [Ignavibacteria bacterium]HMQ99396.1 alpha/beta hydrolase [Ignavibacteria bacterium]